MILDDIAFRGLLTKGEHIHYVAHVHPFTLYPKLFKSMTIGIAMPIIGYFLMPPFLWGWVAWGALGVAIFLYQVAQWYLDAWIITNSAVIDQEWRGLFDKQMTRIEFGNIEGVTTEVKGFWGTILRYGTLQIEHMSGTAILINKVSRPRKVERYIVKYQQDFTRRQNMEDHGKLKELLTSLLRSNVKM